MVWKGLKILAAATIAAAVTTQVVKTIYKYIVSSNSTDNLSNPISHNLNSTVLKFREINDVIMFTDEFICAKTQSNLSPSDSRGENYQKLLKYISNTKETLDVCMYSITNKEIAEQLIRLGQKHVLIRIIIDAKSAFIENSQLKRLEKYSFISIQCNQTNKIMHHKFCVIDGPKAIRRKHKIKSYVEQLNTKIIKKGTCANGKNRDHLLGIIMSGSLNWTQHAVTNYCDSVIVTSQVHLVDKFETEFSKLWIDKEMKGLEDKLKVKPPIG